MTADFVVENQDAQIALLSDPAAYGLPADAEITRIDTHASVVFLAGAYVYKLKRAVRFSFMDYGTAEARRDCAEAEVALNRRTAPALYLGVAPIAPAPEATAHDLRLGERGERPADAVDWVVVMRRFDADTLFDRQAAEGRLTDAALIALAREIARFHRVAEPVTSIDWPAASAAIARDNLADIAAGEIFDAAAVETLRTRTEAALTDGSSALARRGARVRHCHGDLHLRNICEVEGAPTLFDAVEFNDAFAQIDPLYDIAFLLMDLDHRGLPAAAALVRDRYLEAMDDYADQGVLPLYLSMRAAIRAKVSAAAAAVQSDAAEAEAQREEARAYLDRAGAYLAPAAPRLVAVGGFSGTGKSTLARRIAHLLPPAPGAVVLRSDAIRKALWGHAEDEPLPPEAYAESAHRQVYATMESRAEALLAAGLSVIADATFTHPDSRDRIARCAEAAGARFDGLWLEAGADTLKRRVDARVGDASDADAAIVERQRRAGAGTVDWTRLDAGGGPDAVGARAAAALGLAEGGTG